MIDYVNTSNNVNNNINNNRSKDIKNITHHNKN